MKIELDSYRSRSLSGDELCVAAAFLHLPCLYGVSGEWIRSSRAGLKDRVTGITAGLENRGILLAEPGGVVRMEAGLHDILGVMGRAGRVGRVCFSRDGGEGRLCLYQDKADLVFMEPDARGSCHLGRLPGIGTLRRGLLEPPKADAGDGGKGAGDGFLSLDSAEEWLGALVFQEREGRFFERVFDLAWTRERAEELTAAWSRLCDALEYGGEESGI